MSRNFTIIEKYFNYTLDINDIHKKILFLSQINQCCCNPFCENKDVCKYSSSFNYNITSIVDAKIEHNRLVQYKNKKPSKNNTSTTKIIVLQEKTTMFVQSNIPLIFKDCSATENDFQNNKSKYITRDLKQNNK